MSKKEVLFDERKHNNDLLIRTVEMYQRQQPYVDSDDEMTKNTAVTMTNIALLQMWVLTQDQSPALPEELEDDVDDQDPTLLEDLEDDFVESIEYCFDWTKQDSLMRYPGMDPEMPFRCRRRRLEDDVENQSPAFSEDDEKLDNLKSTVDFNYEMQKKRDKVYEEYDRLVAACDFEAAKKELDKLDLPEYQYMDIDCSVDSDQESTKQVASVLLCRT